MEAEQEPSDPLAGAFQLMAWLYGGIVRLSRQLANGRRAQRARRQYSRP